jgi:hypothetical protein
MEVNKEITVRLTPEELESIIIKHLNSEGINIKSVYYNVKGYHQEGDWRSEYPLNYKMDEVICKGTWDFK